MTPDREPIAQAINSMIETTNGIGRMVIRPDTYDEVLAELDALYTLQSNIWFILSAIKETEDLKEKKWTHPVEGE
jgi:hypothetical protein